MILFIADIVDEYQIFPWSCCSLGDLFILNQSIYLNVCITIALFGILPYGNALRPNDANTYQ